MVARIRQIDFEFDIFTDAILMCYCRSKMHEPCYVLSILLSSCSFMSRFCST